MTDYKQQTKTLIDELKAICTSNGLGNDGNEFKIITQVFLFLLKGNRKILRFTTLRQVLVLC